MKFACDCLFQIISCITTFTEIQRNKSYVEAAAECHRRIIHYSILDGKANKQKLNYFITILKIKR